MAASAENVAEILGGQKILGRRMASADDWMSIIESGLPAKAAEALKAHVGLDDANMAAALGVSTRTLARSRAGGTRFDAVVSDRLYRLARLVALARTVLEQDDRALQWLMQPQFGLGRRRPIDLVKSEPGAREIENLLLRIEYGVYS